MCLILFAYKHHPKYPLIVAANRDEFYSRPTIGILANIRQMHCLEDI